jgi:WD40 repeat protein
LSALFLRGGKHLLTLHPGGTSIQDWDLSMGHEIQSWQGVEDAVTAAGSPDGQWCFVLGWHGTGMLRNLATGHTIQRNLNFDQPWDVAFSPDGKFIAAASELGFAGLWEAATLREVTRFRSFLQGVHSVAFSPDSRRLAVGSNGNEAIKLWDLDSLQEVLTLEGQGSVFSSTAFSPDGNSIASVNLHGSLQLWRAPSWPEIAASDKLRSEFR